MLVLSQQADLDVDQGLARFRQKFFEPLNHYVQRSDARAGQDDRSSITEHRGNASGWN